MKPDTIKYVGQPPEAGVGPGHVTVDGRPLPVRLDIINHSPDGFQWGYHGSGPAQLALAMLADFTGDRILAVRLHQPFKRLLIAGLAKDEGWTLTGDQVRRAVEQLRTECDA